MPGSKLPGSSTHEERSSCELLDSGNEQTFVADRLNHRQLTVSVHPPFAWRSAPGRGFGTDFWHAVEFSRNGRAPAEVSRPVLGQPIHAMSAPSPLSKRGLLRRLPRSGRSRVRLPVGRIETKNPCPPSQIAPSQIASSLTRRVPHRRHCACPCAAPATGRATAPPRLVSLPGPTPERC
jgi:hypothetical protein